jgi:hypothetical protein
MLLSKRLKYLGSIGLLLGGLAGGTPPRPPAELELVNREALSKAELRDGSFAVAFRVIRNEQVSDLSVQVRVLAVDPIKPSEVDRFRHSVEREGQEARLEVKIPQRQELGTYRIEVELLGAVDGRSGVIDREILYQAVERDRQRLLLPADLRSYEKQTREKAFQRQLRKTPDRPDTRLLDPGTVAVPRNFAIRATAIKDRPQLLVRGTGPAEDLRRYISDRSGKAWGAQDPITVRGRIVYQDFEGTWRPLVNVSVNLYDDDTFGDEHLGTTVTDANGNWSFSVDNDDGWLQNGRDIYYRFHLGNTRWDVHDDDGDQYRWQSATHDDLSDGAVVDFGTETGSTDATAMQVFGIINLGWIHITASGGQDPGYIEVKHPTSGTFHSAGVVNVESGDNDGPDTILHEYGHGLMYRAFGNTSISPGGAHGFDDDSQDAGLAYSEGWATGYMLSLCPDGAYNWHEGSTEGAGEWPTCTTQNDAGRAIERFSDAGNRVGERTEGRVAAAINDFRDAANDDNGGSEDRGRNSESDANSGSRISLATIYRDSMWGFVHNDFLEFWTTFAGNLTGTFRDRADDIMQYNWMSVPIEVSCVASKVTASLREDSEGLLAGLRAFRDHALKPVPEGRRWIQSYYTHSPELAMILIRDAEARKAALGVIDHFSRLGHAFSKRAELERLIDGNQQVLPADVSKAIGTVAAAIEANGSPELRREMSVLQEELRSLSGLSLDQAIRRAERTPIKPGAVLPPVRANQLSPASRQADWKLIQEYLPRARPEAGVRQNEAQ